MRIFFRGVQIVMLPGLGAVARPLIPQSSAMLVSIGLPGTCGNSPRNSAAISLLSPLSPPTCFGMADNHAQSSDAVEETCAGSESDSRFLGASEFESNSGGLLHPLFPWFSVSGLKGQVAANNSSSGTG